MKPFKHLPEVTVTSAFIPMGVFMGYIMQYHFAATVNQNVRILFNVLEWWPWVAASAAAILTSIILFWIKLKFRQYKYEHLYFLIFGMLVFLIAGILFLTIDTPYAAIYMSFIAHGICYVPALTYLNIRMGKTKLRFLRLSLPLMFYMLSVAIGATVVYTQQNLFIANVSTTPISNIIGILLIVFSTWTIVCILTLMFCGSQNYKSSLDEDTNRENTNLTIFERKYFMITSKNGHITQTAQPTMLNKPIHGFIFFVFVIISKITSIMYFYWPFILIHHTVSVASQNFDLFLINWFGFGGVVISTALLIPLTYKVQQTLGTKLKLAYMTILVVLFSYDHWDTMEITVIMWFLFLTLGITYPNCDINILSFTNLKYTEIVLAIGYVVVHITVGVIQYITLQTPNRIINLTSTFQMVFTHALTFTVILFILALIGMFIMPRYDYKSLLELQNYINTFHLCNDNEEGNIRSNDNLQTDNIKSPAFPSFEHQMSTQPPAYYSPSQSSTAHHLQPKSSILVEVQSS